MTSPAGWYPDPEQTPAPGRPAALRWWNGAAWTDDRTAAQQPSVPAGTAPLLQKQPQQPHPQQPHPQQPQTQQTQPYGAYPSSGWGAAPPVAGTSGAYGGKATTTPAGEPLAGLGGRLVARLIDGLVVAVVSALVSIPFYAGMVDVLGDYLDELSANPNGEAATDPFFLYRDTEFLLNIALATLVGLVVSALYEVLFLRLRSATPGKLAMGMRVRRWDAPRGGGPDQRLGWGTAVGRWATQNLPTQVLALWALVDSLWCTWDGRRQTLHDKVVGTTVVSVRR